MPREYESENRSGPRYLASLEVKAEWDEPSGAHVIAEGTTENVGPEGTLVHLPRQLPQVGSRVRLEVLGETGLPRARLAADQHRRAEPAAGLVERSGQHVELRGPLQQHTDS